ncbi:C-C chemokine receptor type [Trichinella spiralis]|uniref:C-C chemokine receptor type n=1 Tax=Trichinella spiralis TaxID=6334 RepID=A0ABR3K2J2_TRISP
MCILLSSSYYSVKQLGASTADGNEHVDLVVLAYRISVFHFIGVTPSLAVCWAQIRERWKDYLQKFAKSQMPEELTKQQYQRIRLCRKTTGLHTTMVKEEENDRSLLTSTF